MITKKEQWVNSLHRALLTVSDRDFEVLKKILKYADVETLKRDTFALLDVEVIDKDKLRRL